MSELLHEQKDPWGVSNPHPGHGKDDNIANEFGHTHYPKYVHLFDKEGKITDSKLVENEDQEREAEGYTVAWVKPKPEVKSKAKVKTAFDKD